MNKLKVGVVTEADEVSVHPSPNVDLVKVEGSTFEGDFLIDATESPTAYFHKGEELKFEEFWKTVNKHAEESSRKEDLQQKYIAKVDELKGERQTYIQTHKECQLELISIKEQLDDLLQDYNNVVTLLNGSAYNADKIRDELQAYGDFVETLKREYPLELRIK